MIDLRQYVDLQYFQYSVLRTVALDATDNGGITKIQNDSDFLLQKVIGSQTDASATVQAVDTGTGRQFFDRALNLANYLGTAQRPNVLLHPKLIKANSQINWTFVDTSGAENRIEVVLEGIKAYKTLPSNFVPRGVIQLEKYRDLDPFTYTFNPTALGALGTGIAVTNIQADSDFIITKLVATSTGTFRAQIADLSCGWLYSDNFIDNVNLFGTAQQPNVLLHPQLVLANSSIQVQLSDTSNAENTIQIAVEGIKAFL